MKERLRWQERVLRMKDDRLPKVVLLANRLGLYRKQAVLVLGGRRHKERSKGNGSFLEGCKKGGFEQIELEEERVQLCWLRAAWCCGELFVALVYTKILILFFPKKIKNVCLFIIIFCLFISRNMTVSNQ